MNSVNGYMSLKKKLDTGQISRVITSETRNNYFGDIMGWIIPIILLVVIWLFIFRRMSGGAGGGAGNIFNVGKSKARYLIKTPM